MKPCGGSKAYRGNDYVETLSSATVKKCYTVLTAGFSDAKKWHYIDEIPEISRRSKKGRNVGPGNHKGFGKAFKELQRSLRIPKEEQIEFQGLRKSGQMHKVRLTQNNYQLVAENSGQSPEVLMSNYNEAREIEKRALTAMVERSFYPEIAVSTSAGSFHYGSAEPKSRPCRSDFEESASSNGLCATEHHSHRLAKFSKLNRACCRRILLAEIRTRDMIFVRISPLLTNPTEL